MTTEQSPATEKSISETDFPQLWRGLTHNQQRFAVAMLDSTSKKDAALMVGIEPDTVYRWNGALDDVIAFMRTKARDAAIEILANSVVKAAMVKVAGLDSDDEKARQDAAAEVLDRVLGKPTSRTEVSGPNNGPIETKTAVRVDVSELSDDDIDALAAIAGRVANDTQGASAP